MAPHLQGLSAHGGRGREGCWNHVHLQAVGMIELGRSAKEVERTEGAQVQGRRVANREQRKV